MSAMFSTIEQELMSKCGEMPGQGTLPDGTYSRLFKSQKSFDLRKERFGSDPNYRQPPVTEHADDLPQGSLEASYSIGQFTLSTSNITYSGWVESDGCKCGIDWNGELSVYDTPGVTTSEDGKAGMLLEIINETFGVPIINGSSVKIAYIPIGGYVCCDKK